MIRIIFLFTVTLLFSNSAFSKSPPPGTGSLVPSNIMIMLDNSGSMSWDLSGNEITGSGFLNRPTEVKTDSSGDVYVYQPGNSYFEGKYYRMHVFGSDGTLKRRILSTHTNYWNPECSKQNISNYKFDIHNDKIYTIDGNYYRIKISEISLQGNCIRQSGNIDLPRYGSYPQQISSIAVTNNYIFLGTGSCSFYCYTNRGGSILVYNKSDFSFVKKIYGTGNYYNHNTLGDITSMQVNSNETKLVVTNNQGTVSLYNISGPNLSFSSYVGNRCTSRPNYGGSCYRNAWGGANGYFYSPYDAAFDSSGNIFVVEVGNHRIQKFNSSGSYLGKFGSVNYSGNAFWSPAGLHISSAGKMYVADTQNDKVRELSFNASHVGSVSSTFSSEPKSRMDIAHKVIKRIVSNTELTSSANFGLMEWGHPYRSIRWSNAPKNSAWRYNWYGTRIRVPVSDDGARLIYTDIDNVKGGGGTYLSPALTIARSYFANGHSGFPSPRIANATCQTNYLIVISDGVWANPSTVRSQVLDLKNQYQIKTFSVGFAVSSASASTKQNYVDVAVNGGTVAPLYADNEVEMIAKLTDAIKQVTSGSLTFNTPAVMSDKQRGDFIYQSTFKYSKNTQWEGHLKKNKFDSKTGDFVTCALDTCWDAAEKLNKKSASSRNIWTTGTGYDVLNNFKTDYRDRLKTFLFPNKSATDAETDNLINFIRGQDSYDENGNGNTTETRHKLADIYHANINVVGPVEDNFEENDGTANYDKKDNHYRFRNGYRNFKEGNSCGGTCSSRDEVVLAGSNGGILHAFKASDGEELWGFIPPNLIHKLSTMVTSKANASNPIYGIDGTAAVKDIYFDDTPNDGVTNPRWRTILISGLGAGGHGYFVLDITDFNSPKHLFAIENDPFKKVINIWGADQIKEQYFYSSGNAISEDYDYRKLGEAWSAPNIIRIKDNGKDKWVAVVGGGFNSATNPNYGSAVFVIDLETEGQILKKIDIEDTATSNIVNSIPGDLAVVTANETEKANYNGALVYAADLEGKITKINLTDQGTMYETTILFDAQSTNENGRYIFKKPMATIKDSKFWLYFGTGDMQKLQKQTSSISNRLYGIKDKDFPNYKTISPTGTVAQCKTGSNNCPSTADLGWYIGLDKSKKVTAKPTIDKNVVYFPVYEPKTAGNVCDTGDAVLYTANLICGSATQRRLGKGVSSEVVIQGKNLIIGISGEADKNLKSKDNLISLRSTQQSSSQKVTLDGWKEN